ncbi:hypothetical protein [Nioella aestuarii]|uniref:hypothetical protein n=1 Tax=Nioella aestuarii TaxID=1662864 RepID=UPI003D7F91ED
MTQAGRHIALKIILLAWVAIMGISIFGYILTEASGDGFTRGLNRIMVFLGWQIAGLVVALICLFLRARVEPGRPLRWVAMVPALVAGAQVLAILSLFLATSANVR